MEGIIIAAILWLVFRAIGRKAREMQGTAGSRQPGQTAGQTQQRQPAPQQRQPAPQRRDAPERSMRAAPLGSSAAQGEGEAAYRTIRPTVQADNVMSDYAGSLEGGTREGIAARAASAEGAPSSEGEDTRDLALDHARAQSMQAYAIHSGESEAQTLLPLHWTGDELVRGFVFSEILAKPRNWGEHHG